MPEAGRAAHQRLFGKGAKVSNPPADSPEFGGSKSTDELAMMFRPRADAGKDINLPKAKK